MREDDDKSMLDGGVANFNETKSVNGEQTDKDIEEDDESEDGKKDKE